jgi:Putative zinc-finger
MSDDAKAAAILHRLLEGTRDEELDCDRFLELLPAFLEGKISDAELRELIEHHAEQCPECSEELEIVRRALDPNA